MSEKTMEHDDMSIEDYCREGDKVLLFGLACIAFMLAGIWWVAVPV